MLGFNWFLLFSMLTGMDKCNTVTREIRTLTYTVFRFNFCKADQQVYETLFRFRSTLFITYKLILVLNDVIKTSNILVYSILKYA